MSTTSLEKSIWSEKILQDMYNRKGVFVALAAHDFQEEAKLGSTVKINTQTDFTTSDYSGTVTYTTASYTAQSLLIDQDKYLAKKVEDGLQRQYDISFMSGIADSVTRALVNTADSYVAALHDEISGSMYVNASNITIGTAAETSASASAYDTIVDLGILLDNNGVSSEDRFVICTPWFVGKLVKDSRFTDKIKYLENGVVDGGVIGNMQVHMSRNVVSSGSADMIMAGVPSSLQFAAGLNSLEFLRPDNSFSDAIRAHFVYGAKIVNSTGMALVKAVEYTA